MENSWTKTERSLYLIAYGITASALALWAIATFIEACRSRPKVQVLMLGHKPGKAKDQAPAESSSAAE